MAQSGAIPRGEYLLSGSNAGRKGLPRGVARGGVGFPRGPPLALSGYGETDLRLGRLAAGRGTALGCYTKGKIKSKHRLQHLSIDPNFELLKKSALSVAKLHLPHGYYIDVVILSLETASTVWCLSVGFSFQDEAMDVARSAPQGAHNYADVIYLFP